MYVLGDNVHFRCLLGAIMYILGADMDIKILICTF